LALVWDGNVRAVAAAWASALLGLLRRSCAALCPASHLRWEAICPGLIMERKNVFLSLGLGQAALASSRFHSVRINDGVPISRFKAWESIAFSRIA